MAVKTVSTFPQSLQARQIINVGPLDSKTSSRVIRLSGGSEVLVTQVMLNQFSPSVGDYYVVPSEGHPYMVAKSTFAATYTAGG